MWKTLWITQRQGFSGNTLFKCRNFGSAFFVKGFSEKHKKFSWHEKALVSRAFGILFFIF